MCPARRGIKRMRTRLVAAGIILFRFGFVREEFASLTPSHANYKNVKAYTCSPLFKYSKSAVFD